MLASNLPARNVSTGVSQANVLSQASIVSQAEKVSQANTVKA
jgi:hypothetical protein